MGCPIVNTPFTRDSVCNTKPSLPRQWWNSAPSCDGRELPPYPRHYPGPWLGPLSFIVRHTPVGPPWTVRPVGTSTTVARGEATNNMSQFRWHHTRQRRVLLIRPAGFVIAVDNPMRRSHRPRACAPSCQQRYEVTIDGPMQFAFADPLCLPTSGHRLTVCRCVRRVRGLPTLRQATFRTLRRPEVRARLWAASDSGSISFVSYFSFASKRLEPQRFIAIWSHAPILTQKRLKFRP
jgi:hypothetical protein